MLPFAVALSFYTSGWITFIPVIYSFTLIPLFELLIPPNPRNIEGAEREVVKKDRLYDYLLYSIVPLQYVFLILYFISISEESFGSMDFWGRTISMGLMCGIYGINVAHELGHRQSKVEQFMSRMLLATSLYGHFFVEHNYGHHKRVATAEDPASARLNENLYAFWMRSIFYSYISAWKIQMQMLRRKKASFWSLQNEVFILTVVQVSGVLLIGFSFGWTVAIGFAIAAIVGMLLLETVNYIEHYGLVRTLKAPNRYEDAGPEHSWNSNHVLGRLFLFELSRHSDHHAYPHKKYQLLDHHNESPQLPTGYPGSMLLATVPPLWFRIVNKRIEEGLQTG